MRILIVDFWSDGNLGDAIMQEEILHQAKAHSGDIHVLSCFGANQFQLNAFFSSLKFAQLTWHPAIFNTFINLDRYFEQQRGGRILRLIRSSLALAFTDFRLWLFRRTKSRIFLGRHRYLVDLRFDAIILNGRNYRDFGSRLKNYINNRPLLLHQLLVSALYPEAPKLNAGVSVWSLDRWTQRTVSSLWPKYVATIARERRSYEFLQSLGIRPLILEKDLSFPYLGRSDVPSSPQRGRVAFSLTHISHTARYVSELNKLLLGYFRAGMEIVLVRQVYLAQENTDALEKDITVPHTLFMSRDTTDVLHFYATCSFVVSTRMHGSIMALSVGVPTVSIAYDAGAKWSIISDEIPGYPLFTSTTFTAAGAQEYLESAASGLHAKTFQQATLDSKRLYVSEFLRGIDTKPQ